MRPMRPVQPPPEMYVRRIVDDEIDRLVRGGSAAIAIEGAKAVGKTATGSQRVRIAYLLEQSVTRQLLQADPSRINSGEPVLIDEWQHLPETWDVVRRVVDAGAVPGQFFLTGSASALHPGTHSGAGRIVSVRMRPMSLYERGVGAPTVSLEALLEGTRHSVRGETDIKLEHYVSEMFASGFPAIRRLSESVRRAHLDGYIQRIIDRDFPDTMGRRVRNPGALRRWITAYAAATSTVTSYERIRDAATSGEGNKPSKTTTQPYRDTLEALYVLDPLLAWSPTRNRIAELASAPKHHLVDTALVTTLLGLDIERVLADGSHLGQLFESLVLMCVRPYAQAAEATVRHLRTHGGEHEIDMIIQRRDGKVVALETKLSASVSDTDVKHLLWLRKQLGERLIDAVVVNTGVHAYRRTDGIAVIPAALLGP